LNTDTDHRILYGQTLSEYCSTHSEESLYRASLLSGHLIQQGLGPEEIVGLHYEGMQTVAQDESLPHTDRLRILNDAHQFLLEVMIAYGAQYKEYLDLRLAEAVRRAETAEHGEREKLEILGMIAHELGNPLTIALGNLQMAVNFLDSQDMTNVRELVTDSREALEKLAVLTSQLLAASRGEEVPLSREPIDLRHAVARAHMLATKFAQAKHISVSLEQATEPVIVIADEEALDSVLNNLTSNAVRYTHAGGTVTLFTREEDGSGVVGVRDTGIGMSPEVASRLFEKFYRSEDARRIEPAGLGMGLNIVRRLVTALDGSIQVESEPGHGSTFTVRLPAVEKVANDD
jgi:signal transduction histidine kinase